MALPAEEVLDDLLTRRSTGRCGSLEGLAQLVVALEDPGEPEQLVLDLVDVALGRDHA